MNSSLVGYTGFVGSNIAKKFSFSNLHNSKNIEQAFNTKPDLLIYSGVRAEKYLANQNPEQDFEIIKNAFVNIKKINAKKIVLISTVDVYKNPSHQDEDTEIDIANLHPYGLNRYYLEQWVENEFNDTLILRLPSLYGINIKKNFIYDLINVIPFMLNNNKYEELVKIDPLIKNYYIDQKNGYYKCIVLLEEEKKILKDYYNRIGFSAVNFTDSRAKYQFYNLNNLWEHIDFCLTERIRKLNLSTEPVTSCEIFKHITNKEFVNEFATEIPNYDLRTKHYEVFNGRNGYIYSKDMVLNDIKEFVEGYRV